MSSIGFFPVYISVYFLMLASVLAVASLQESWFSFLTSLVFWGAVYGIGLFFGFRHSREPNPKSEQIMNGVAGIGVTAFLLSLVTQGLIPALAQLLMWLQAAKNVTLSQRRDLYFAFTITFILMLYAAATSASTSFLFFMVAYALAGILAMVTNFIDERLSLAEASGSRVDRYNVPIKYSVFSLSGIVIVVAASLYLFVPRPAALNLGAFFSGGDIFYDDRQWEKEAEDGRNVPDQEEFSDKKPDPGSAADASTDGSDQAGSVDGDDVEENSSAMVPDDKQPISADDKQDGQQADDFAYSGFRDEMDMSQVGADGSLNNALVMYVQASQPLYLRGRVFDTFENNAWSSSNNHRRKYKVDFEGIELGTQHEPQVQQIITLKRNISSQIFAAARLEKLNFPGSVIARDAYGSIYTPGILQEGTIYSAQSYIPLAQGRPSSGPEPLRDLDGYLQLPRNLSPKVEDLSRELTTGGAGDFEKARLLESFLRNEFFYTLNTVRDPFTLGYLENFLFETRRGHCELFASSMVLMARTLGIPARLVTGFSATNLNPVTGYIEVRGMDAHAWVEVYIKQFGWVTFEPTSFYTLPQLDQPATTAEAMKQYLENLSRTTEAADPGSLSNITLSSVVNIMEELSSMLGVMWDMIKALLYKLYQWFLVLAPAIGILIAILVAGYFIYLRLQHPIQTRLALLRLSRMGNSQPKEMIIACYGEMENFFDRSGKPRPMGMPLGEYVQELALEYEGLQDKIQEITRRTNIALYDKSTCTEAQAKSVMAGFRDICKHQPEKRGLNTHLD